MTPAGNTHARKNDEEATRRSQSTHDGGQILGEGSPSVHAALTVVRAEARWRTDEPQAVLSAEQVESRADELIGRHATCNYLEGRERRKSNRCVHYRFIV